MTNRHTLLSLWMPLLPHGTAQMMEAPLMCMGGLSCGVHVGSMGSVGLSPWLQSLFSVICKQLLWLWVSYYCHMGCTVMQGTGRGTNSPPGAALASF